MHTKGYSANETRASLEEARASIERAEALGERPEDPLAAFSVLYGFWAATYLAFNGDVLCELSAQFLKLARQQRSTIPLVVGHRLVGTSLLHTGNLTDARAHLDSAIALYDPEQHRAAGTRFGQDVGVVTLSRRTLTLWSLGYPEAAIADANLALKDAREIGHAATLMYALSAPGFTHLYCGSYAAAKTQADECVALAEKKGALSWKAIGLELQGCVSAVAGEASDAVWAITLGITEYRSKGATLFVPCYLSFLARANAALGQFEEARSCVDEAMTLAEKTGERWFDAEISRVFGESRCCRGSEIRPTPKPISNAPWGSRAHNRPAPGSFAQRRALRACGAIRAGALKPMTSSRPSTAGSPRASTRST
jgi:tetratricopeptide (TPR) repeat protein